MKLSLKSFLKLFITALPFLVLMFNHNRDFKSHSRSSLLYLTKEFSKPVSIQSALTNKIFVQFRIIDQYYINILLISSIRAVKIVYQKLTTSYDTFEIINLSTIGKKEKGVVKFRSRSTALENY